jgi:hypothetical protein
MPKKYKKSKQRWRKAPVTSFQATVSNADYLLPMKKIRGKQSQVINAALELYRKSKA